MCNRVITERVQSVLFMKMILYVFKCLPIGFKQLFDISDHPITNRMGEKNTLHISLPVDFSEVAGFLHFACFFCFFFLPSVTFLTSKSYATKSAETYVII